MQDTIAAVSTPPGEGAVALIRISGPDAMAILGKIFVPPIPSPRRATHGRIVENDRTVDQVLVTVFQAPASYTGEDIVEIGCHGGVLLAASILELVLRQGARAADPGEFTQRAFLNGKLDLTQAEAVMDLISARTPLAMRAAAEQLQGRLGDEVSGIRADLLENCVSSLMRVTDYDAYEILIVDNDSIEDETAMLFFRLEKDPRVRLIHAPGPFNYSKINNQAAANAKGEILIFLNNDIEVREREWMSALVAQAERPTVGAVGAKLYYGDGRIQHGGIVLGVGRDIAVAGNLYSGAAANDPGYFNHLRMARNLSAVTGACLAIRKAVFQEVGGFNEVDLPIAYNDVDICLRVRGAGYQVIWTPYAELTHLESASRGSDDQASQLQRYATEISYMRRKWEATLERDPFYGPNFDRVRGDFRLRTRTPTA